MEEFMSEKIKACIVSADRMCGIEIKNVTFHDLDQKIFSIGRERSKRKLTNLANCTVFMGHLNEDELNEEKFEHIDNVKRRGMPPRPSDIDRDLNIWKKIKSNPSYIFNDLEPILNDLKK